MIFNTSTLHVCYFSTGILQSACSQTLMRFHHCISPALDILEVLHCLKLITRSLSYLGRVDFLKIKSSTISTISPGTDSIIFMYATADVVSVFALVPGSAGLWVSGRSPYLCLSRVLRAQHNRAKLI